jgi:acetyl-CoA C-acetyltransferase/acetyl-CoA acyltransferase
VKKPVYISGGFSTVFMGKGRSEFNPENMRTFESYLQETAAGTRALMGTCAVDEGIISSFMPGRFINQGHIAGFLPFMMPQLAGKPCTGVEAACCSGGRALAMGVRSVLSEMADTVFIAGFEIQNSMKAIDGADVLAGASYYKEERKKGHPFFFPGVFSDRAGAYYDLYGYDAAREGMALWYEQMILNARKNPKAQEYENSTPDLFAKGMTKPDPAKFLPHLNTTDCSKISDGAASVLILSEAGLEKCGINKKDAVKLVAMGEAEADITQLPSDLTRLTTMEKAVAKALANAGLTIDDIAILEIHDCFTITALLALEAIGIAKPGKAHEAIKAGICAPAGSIPTNLSGGLGGFGHPTGATGVRQMVDLQQQLLGIAPNQAKLKSPYAMMVNMGGNDKTVTALIVSVDR